MHLTRGHPECRKYLRRIRESPSVAERLRHTAGWAVGKIDNNESAGQPDNRPPSITVLFSNDFLVLA